MKKSLKADLMLLFVSLSWGFSYYISDIALSGLGVFSLNFYRFLIAFFIAFLLTGKKLIRPNRMTLKYSIGCGLVLYFVYIGANMGVKYTTLSNTGFLATMSVIFTPIFAFIYARRIPNKTTILAVIMCFIGIALLTLKDGFTLNTEYLKGDLYSILCAVSYAHHLLLTERAVKRKEVDVYQLSVYQFLVCGVLNLVTSFIFKEPMVPETGRVWTATLFLAVFCTGIAFIIQAIAQQYTTATHVAVIFSLEPVFAGIVAYFLAGERLGSKAYLGAILMVSSIFIMELRPLKSEKERT